METRPLAILVQLRQSGWGFCRSCGKLGLEPGSPEWMTRCRRCYEADAALKYCSCGEEIDKTRRLWAIRHGQKPTWCYWCSRGGPVPCGTCGFVHPRHWHSVPVPPRP